MKSVVNKLLDLLNIHPDENQKYILIFSFISTLISTYIAPIIEKTTITLLPAEWLSIEAIAFSVSGLVIGILWKNKFRHKMIKYFLVIICTESFITFVLAMYLCFINFNVWVYAIVSAIYGSLICVTVNKCIMAFRSHLWVEKEREIYDNNSSIVIGIVCIVGYVISLINMPSIEFALFLWGCCCVLDDVGWIIVYIKNRDKLKNIE